MLRYVSFCVIAIRFVKHYLLMLMIIEPFYPLLKVESKGVDADDNISKDFYFGIFLINNMFPCM